MASIKIIHTLFCGRRIALIIESHGPIYVKVDHQWGLALSEPAIHPSEPLQPVLLLTWA